MVKLKPAKKYLRDFYLLPEQVEAYSETDMMMGVRFLQQYAIREKSRWLSVSDWERLPVQEPVRCRLQIY